MSTRANFDRKLGYVLMALVLFAAAGYVYYFLTAEKALRETRVMRFPQVGSLAVQDPVRMEGTLVGQITGFEYDDSGRVIVHIASREPIPIRTSSRAAVKVKGVMGERFIEVSMGNLSDPLIDKNQIIDGVFEMGPSEAIAYMDLLDGKITELKEIMLWLRDGRDDGKRPFIVAFNDIVGTIDTLTYKLLDGMVGMEEGLTEGIATAANIAQKSIKLTRDVSVKAPEVIEDLSSIVAKIDAIIPKVDKVVTQVQAMTKTIDGNKILWGDDIEKIQKQLAEIKKYVDDIKDEGLPLTVKLRF